jgi:hypothetical protein
MTAPEPVPGLNPIPEHFMPWTKAGCTFIPAPGQRCGTEHTVTLSWLGRRCTEHPPSFDPQRAVALMVDGWTDTAFGYCRWAA